MGVLKMDSFTLKRKDFKILITHERSGKIREACRVRGFDAYSNDLVDADDNSRYHFTCDVRDAIKATGFDWDLIIMHPPCTALAVSGNSTYARGKKKHPLRIQAIKDTLELFDFAQYYAPKVAFENPVGVLPLKPDQYIQPYQFGHPESKKTGLWLCGLPLLKETCNVFDIYKALPRKEAMRLHYLPPSKDRAKIRSETFQGIANAIANQWAAGSFNEISEILNV
jgi:hypothetical protein